MRHPSEPGFLVLHTLRCIGVAGESRLARASGLSPIETRARLARLSDGGLVRLDPGPFGGWALTDHGLATAREQVQAELESAGSRDRVHKGFDSVLALNPTLLEICTAWQMRTVGRQPILNDHKDADYDASVISRLMRIDESAQRLCDELSVSLTRFGHYGLRLTEALDRVLAGEGAYFADDLESYHTVWFQLHEDLLTTLGLSRGGDAWEASR